MVVGALIGVKISMSCHSRVNDQRNLSTVARSKIQQQSLDPPNRSIDTHTITSTLSECNQEQLIAVTDMIAYH